MGVENFEVTRSRILVYVVVEFLLRGTDRSVVVTTSVCETRVCRLPRPRSPVLVSRHTVRKATPTQLSTLTNGVLRVMFIISVGGWTGTTDVRSPGVSLTVGITVGLDSGSCSSLHVQVSRLTVVCVRGTFPPTRRPPKRTQRDQEGPSGCGHIYRHSPPFPPRPGRGSRRC